MITKFRGEYAFLSNFYGCDIHFEGRNYRSVEHAYVAAKTLDPELRFEICLMATPGEAKQFGKWLQLRPNWNKIKVDIMRSLLIQKFSDPDLMSRLDATAPHELIEGNDHHDRFWGQCPLGDGKNMLGKLLMEIRDDPFRKFLS